MELYLIRVPNTSSQISFASRTSFSAVRSALIGSLFAVNLMGCSSLSIESAQKLGAIGSETSTQISSNIFYSDDKYERAMEAEAFFHAMAGVAVPDKLAKDYAVIQRELIARKNSFSKLTEVYDGFYQLASINSDTGLESAINNFGSAVNGYAAARNQPEVFKEKEVGIFAKIGGFTSKEIQKRKLQESSALIRQRLLAMSSLLSDPLVRSEIVGFGQNLTTTNGAVVNLLWQKDLLDATPLVDQIGLSADLKSAKDISKIIADPKDQKIKNGLNGIIAHRLERKIKLVEANYDSSVLAIGELIKKHALLEAGEEIDLAKIRQIIAELNSVAMLLNG